MRKLLILIGSVKQIEQVFYIPSLKKIIKA